MVLFSNLPASVVMTIYEFGAMKDEFKTVLNEIEVKYDDGKWLCYRHRPQRPMRKTRKEPFPDRYGRRRAVRFTTDEDNLVGQQYWRKRRMLNSLSDGRWGFGRFAAYALEEFQQHKYNYTTWEWLRTFDHEASVQYFIRVVKPYHDQHRDMIYMFGSYLL
jgi:hypothetical protein